MDIKKGHNKYYIGEDENHDIARITWVFENEKTINLNHTFVDPSLRGQGVAEQLLNKAVAFAKEHSYKIKPTCSYAIKKMRASDQYKDILVD